MFSVDIEAELRRFYRYLGIEVPSGYHIDGAEVMIADLYSLADLGDILTEFCEHGRYTPAFEIRRSIEGSIERFAGHETPHRSANESPLRYVAFHPFIPGKLKEGISGEIHMFRMLPEIVSP